MTSASHKVKVRDLGPLTKPMDLPHSEPAVYAPGKLQGVKPSSETQLHMWDEFRRARQTASLSFLYAFPLPRPTSWTDHGILPTLFVILSYYIDEGIGLVMSSSFLLGPTWSGGRGLIQAAWPELDETLHIWIYALYIAAYAILQFLLSPSTGAASDIYGRKVVLKTCLVAWCIATAIQGVAITWAFDGTSLRSRCEPQLPCMLASALANTSTRPFRARLRPRLYLLTLFGWYGCCRSQ